MTDEGEVVWWPRSPTVAQGRVAVVTVSYNTRELTAFLLWSLRTILSWPELEIVVVDNGSRDGSARLLAEAARAGECTLLANDDNRQHGPGLNQGISHLAGRPGPHPEWIWVLDSDVVVTRPDARPRSATTRCTRGLRPITTPTSPRSPAPIGAIGRSWAGSATKPTSYKHP